MQKWHKHDLVLYILILSLSFGIYWLLDIPSQLRKIFLIIAKSFENKIYLNDHFYFFSCKKFRPFNELKGIDTISCLLLITTK